MVDNSSLLYLLGPSSNSTTTVGGGGTLLSFKLNSTIVRHLSEARKFKSDVSLQFVSPQVAKVVLGDVEYELQFADINATDCYKAAACLPKGIDGDAVVMAHCGSVVARYQIMKSNKLAGSGWRTSVATTGSSCSAEVSIHPTTLQAATKRSREVIAVASSSSRLVMKKAKVSRCIAPADVPVPPLKRAEARLTNTFLMLVEVPIVASPQDLMSSLLSGLSISNFYLCGLPAADIAADTCSVSLFVEFSSLDGAELGLRRSGESCVVHRPISTDEQLVVKHANPPAKHLVIRSTVSVHATTDQQAAWVRAAAWRLPALGSHSMLSHMQLLGEFLGRHRGLVMLSMAAATRPDDHWLVAMKLAIEFHKDRTMDAYDGTAAKVVVNQQDVKIVSVTRMRSPIRADRLLHLLDGAAEDIPKQKPAVGCALVEGREDGSRPGGTASSFSLYRAALDTQHSLLSRSMNAAEAEVCRLSRALADLLLVTLSASQRDSAAATAATASAPNMAKYVVGHMNRRLTLCKHLCAQLRRACNTYVMHSSCPDVG